VAWLAELKPLWDSWFSPPRRRARCVSQRGAGAWPRGTVGEEEEEDQKGAASLRLRAKREGWPGTENKTPSFFSKKKGEHYPHHVRVVIQLNSCHMSMRGRRLVEKITGR
jgi:hypothetical protein